jgi:hypothetical protein
MNFIGFAQHFGNNEPQSQKKPSNGEQTMKRREFFATTVATTGLGLSLAAPARGADKPEGRECYVLNRFFFDSPAKCDAFAEFLRLAVPAFNRAGAAPVGAFRLFQKDNPKLADLDGDPNELWLLLPHQSADSVIGFTERLMADQAWENAEAKSVILAPKKAPAYERFESSLSTAFANMPKMEVPSQSDDRVVQLRMYESHSIERHIRKVAMFNEGGEIEIFRKVGLNPVFFGATVVGSALPNLTYMLQFDDLGALDAAWTRFKADPDWKKLSKDPQYADTVSKITSLILRPLAASQI